MTRRRYNKYVKRDGKVKDRKQLWGGDLVYIISKILVKITMNELLKLELYVKK